MIPDLLPDHIVAKESTFHRMIAFIGDEISTGLVLGTKEIIDHPVGAVSDRSRERS